MSIEIVGNTVRVALLEFIGSLIAFGDKSFGSYPAGKNLPDRCG